MLYSLSEEKLVEFLNSKDKKKDDLIRIIIEMQKRTKGSYTLDKERDKIGDNKEQLVDFITDCGGRIKKGSLKEGEKNPQLKKLSVEELKEIAGNIENRDISRYEFNEIKMNKKGKYETRKNNKELKEVIKKCRGTKTRQRGGSYKPEKVQLRGWGYSF